MPSDKPEMANGNDQGSQSTPDKSSLSAYGLDVGPAPGGKGVKITKVDPSSQASDLGLKEGDVILKIGGHEVNDQASVDDALKGIGDKKVLMLVKTADGQSFITLQRQNG